MTSNGMRKKDKKAKKAKNKTHKKVKKSRPESGSRHRSGPKKIKKPKAIKQVKLSSAERKEQLLARQSHELIEKGRKRGFITYDEILKTFPDIENNILFLDELYEKFGVA